MVTSFGPVFWIGFFAFAFSAIFFDLLYLHRKNEVDSTAKSTAITTAWFTLSMLLCITIYITAGPKYAIEYLTGYIVELSLSMDNVFVFVLIFSYFSIPPKYQHKILFWGILGAIVMRLLLITIGIALIQYFDWIFYIFGAILLYGSYKIVTQKHNADAISQNGIMIWLKKRFNVTDKFHNGKFIIKIKGITYITPLLVALVMVEKTDLVFALDSVPAILAITQEPFIVFSSNVFAILGLRALYFVLASLINKLEYLKYGLGIILFYVGIKMILTVQKIHIPTVISLSIILLCLLGSAAISIVVAKRKGKL